MSTAEDKVLRVAQIRGGAVRAERLFDTSTGVSIGGDQATFRLAPDREVGPWFELFRPTAAGWTLRIDRRFLGEGKITHDGVVVGLATLDAQPDPDEPGVEVVQLAHGDRGKLRIGDSSFLFQFVAAPVVPAPLPITLDFRPGLFAADDGMYLAMLGLQSALALLLSAFVWQADVAEVGLDETVAQVARFEMRSPPPPVFLPAPAAPVVEAVAEVVPVVERVPPAVEPEPVAAVPSPTSSPDPTSPGDARRRMEERIEAGFGGLKLIGTTGEGDLVVNTWSGSQPTDLRLQGVGEITGEEGRGLRHGGTGALEPARVAGLHTLGTGGRSEIGGGAAVVVRPRVSVESDGSVEGPDLASIRREVRRRSGQMKYCFESGLKRNARLGGRVELGWTIEDGQVVAAYVASNGTGDDALGACMVAKLRRWSFVGIDDDEVRWPFVFTAAQ